MTLTKTASVQERIVVDTDKKNAPPFLIVLTGVGDYAYRRRNGVYVVPVGCLKN